MTADKIKHELQEYASDRDAVSLQRFFKTSPGEYGHGDIFIGVRVPAVRMIAKKYIELPIDQISKLVDSEVHEHRLTALIVMAYQFKKADQDYKKKLFDLYIHKLRTGRINNWDLIDVTCDHIVGQYLMDKNRTILHELAKSESLWERRASIMATFAFLKAGQADETINIAKILLNDKEDLIHKSVGWMLREVGKKVDEAKLLSFLDQYSYQMPRTMLRYSIERLEPQVRAEYLKK